LARLAGGGGSGEGFHQKGKITGGAKRARKPENHRSPLTGAIHWHPPVLASLKFLKTGAKNDYGRLSDHLFGLLASKAATRINRSRDFPSRGAGLTWVVGR